MSGGINQINAKKENKNRERTKTFVVENKEESSFTNSDFSCKKLVVVYRLFILKQTVACSVHSHALFFRTAIGFPLRRVFEALFSFSDF
jgi:hypothetical protein